MALSRHTTRSMSLTSSSSSSSSLSSCSFTSSSSATLSSSYQSNQYVYSQPYTVFRYLPTRRKSRHWLSHQCAPRPVQRNIYLGYHHKPLQTVMGWCHQVSQKGRTFFIARGPLISPFILRYMTHVFNPMNESNRDTLCNVLLENVSNYLSTFYILNLPV